MDLYTVNTGRSTTPPTADLSLLSTVPRSQHPSGFSVAESGSLHGPELSAQQAFHPLTSRLMVHPSSESFQQWEGVLWLMYRLRGYAEAVEFIDEPPNVVNTTSLNELMYVTPLDVKHALENLARSPNRLVLLTPRQGVRPYYVAVNIPQHMTAADADEKFRASFHGTTAVSSGAFHGNTEESRDSIRKLTRKGPVLATVVC